MKLLKSSIVAAVACLSVSVTNAEEGAPDIKITNLDSKVVFEKVSIDQGSQGTVLVGKIKKQNYNDRVPAGHVRYSISGSEGEVVAEGVVHYSPSLSLRKWRHGSSFVIDLPENLSAESEISLSYLRGDKDASNPPVH